MGVHTRTDAREFIDYLDGVCRYSGHTLRAYETGLVQYGDFLRRRRRTARTATFEDVIAYAKSLREHKPATARLRLSAVRGLHRYMHAMGYVERDVAAIVPSPRRDRGRKPAPSPGDVAAARATLTSARDRALFGLLYGSALRISEARCALLRDVDLDAGTITVLGKGRSWRTVELDEATIEALDEWITRERGRRRNIYLFPGAPRGSRIPLSETPIRRMLARAERVCALEPGTLTPHALRRARGRTLKRAGADPFLIQAIYGHESLSQTSHYVGDESPTLPDVVRARLAELDAPQAAGEVGSTDSSSRATSAGVRSPGRRRTAPPSSRPTAAHASAGSALSK